MVIVDAADNSLMRLKYTRSPSKISLAHKGFLNVVTCQITYFAMKPHEQDVYIHLICLILERVKSKALNSQRRPQRSTILERRTKQLDRGFHHLSVGITRQQYAFMLNPTLRRIPSDYCGLNGKNLDQIFRQQLEFARQKIRA